MKRSDMLNLMLEVARYHDGSYLEPYAADSLLTAMESAGMLPPVIERDLGIKDSLGNNSTEKISEWEPENEEE